MKINNHIISAFFAFSAAFLPLASQAAVSYFSLEWSGATLGNSATATAILGIDNSLDMNAPYRGSLSSWATSLTLTVSGASSGNNTFTLQDFIDVYYDPAGANFDLTKNFVGQATGGQPWGTPPSIDEGPGDQPPFNDDPLPGDEEGPMFAVNGRDTSGDFNLISEAEGVPTGVWYFTLRTAGGEEMRLTSFTPTTVPEPSATVLMGVAGIALLARRRRA